MEKQKQMRTNKPGWDYEAIIHTAKILEGNIFFQSRASPRFRSKPEFDFCSLEIFLKGVCSSFV